MMKTIAWDIDDVLNDLMRLWFKQKWTKDRSNCKLEYSELIENPPHMLLGVNIDEYLHSIDEYRTSPLYQQMEPVKEVMRWFVTNGNNFRHIALTAVPLIAASASAQWVIRNFGVWIRTFHFVPSKRTGEKIPEYDRNKAVLLKRIGKVDLFIDDSVEQITAVRKLGIQALLYPRPWNRGEMSVTEMLQEIEALS